MCDKCPPCALWPHHSHMARRPQPADLFALVTSALPVVFVCFSTTLNERSFLTVVAKKPLPPESVKGLEALPHLLCVNPVRSRTLAGHHINIESPHSLQLGPKPPNEAATTRKTRRKKRTPQTRRQAKHQPRAKKKKRSRLTIIVDRTIRMKQGLLCSFPTASTTKNRTRTPPKRFFLSNVRCTLLAPTSHHVFCHYFLRQENAPSHPLQKLHEKCGPNFLHTAHQPCTLTCSAPSFFQLMRPRAVHLKGLLDPPGTHGRHLARHQRATFSTILLAFSIRPQPFGMVLPWACFSHSSHISQCIR